VRRGSRIPVTGLWAALVVCVAACAAAPVTSPTPVATTSATPAAPISSSSPSTADPSAAATTPGGSGGIAIDASLLGVLPSQVDGVPLEPDAATAADVTGDPALARSASALGVAIAIAPGASAAADLAVVWVVQLRPGVFNDGFFRNWRDTYDEAACAAAGGVDGHAEAVIAGRDTRIGTCAGGVRTYHIHLARRDLLVSITAAGERRFGELVAAGLTE
jgi:hypothetical protein